MGWTQATTSSTREAYPALLAMWRARLGATGLDDENKLWEFIRTDVCEDAIKDHLLVSNRMSLGKTAYAIALLTLWGGSRNLIVLPRRLIDEWRAELARLEVPDEEIAVLERLGDIYQYTCPQCARPVYNYQVQADEQRTVRAVARICRTCGVPDRRVTVLRRFNFISTRALWTMPPDSPFIGYRDNRRLRLTQRGRTVAKLSLKHTFSDVLKRAALSAVVVEEAYSMKSADSNQTLAITNLRARHRLLLTGTPVRGYAHNILPLLTWAFGAGSLLFPEYNAHEERSLATFRETFGVTITSARGHTVDVPRMRNAERFQAMLAPKMRRRVTTEPEVRACVTIPAFDVRQLSIPLDACQRDLYLRWAQNFVDEYKQLLAARGQEGRPVTKLKIMAKLVSLRQAATIPSVLDPHFYTPTNKQLAVINLARAALEEGRKVIIYSMFNDSLRWYRDCAALADFRPLLIDGSVSLERDASGVSVRTRVLNEFRHGDERNLLVAGMVLAEGLNIPQASTVIFDSYDWTPAVMEQAYSRVLRPQQEEFVEIYMLAAAGTIDDYMAIWNELKRANVAEGLDYEHNPHANVGLPNLAAYVEDLMASDDLLRVYTRAEWLTRLNASRAA